MQPLGPRPQTVNSKAGKVSLASAYSGGGGSRGRRGRIKKILAVDACASAQGPDPAVPAAAIPNDTIAIIHTPSRGRDYVYERIKAMHPAKQWQMLSRLLAVVLQGEGPVLSPHIGEEGWTPVDQAAFAINASWMELYHISVTSRINHDLRFEWRSDASGFDEIRSNPALAPAAPAAPPRHRGAQLWRYHL